MLTSVPLYSTPSPLASTTASHMPTRSSDTVFLASNVNGAQKPTLFAREIAQYGGSDVWARVTRAEILESSSVAYLFEAPDIKMPVQTILDGWPDQSIGRAVMVRFGSQSNCAFNCNFCVASENRFAQNLTTERIVAQVVTALHDPLVDHARVEQIILASFGLGEPLLNPNIVGAFETFASLLPGVHLIVSTTGPKSGERVFAPLLEVAKRSGRFRLQISLHYTTDEERHGFSGAVLQPISALSEWVQRWWQTTGQKAIINCGIGPLFPTWQDCDFATLEAMFPPDRALIKLSIEAPMRPDHTWNVDSYASEMEKRRARLSARGYELQLYDPSGLASGAGCGSQIFLDQ